MFVTEDLKTAVAEAEEFEKNSKYKDLICGKYMKGSGVQPKTFAEKLERLKPYLSEEDIVYYRNFYDKHSTGVCCLPKGHSGPCMNRMDSLIIGDFKKKNCRLLSSSRKRLYSICESFCTIFSYFS